MSDELDRHIKSIRTEQQRQAVFSEWKAQYKALDRDPFIWEGGPLEPLTSGAHFDLLVDYTRRVLAAGMGQDYLILTGPEGVLYAATPHKLYPTKELVPYFGTPCHTWRKQRQLQRANDNLGRDSRPGKLLRLENHHDDNDHVRVAWFVAGNDFYAKVQSYPRWGSRDQFARMCAQVLSGLAAR